MLRLVTHNIRHIEPARKLGVLVVMAAVPDLPPMPGDELPEGFEPITPKT